MREVELNRRVPKLVSGRANGIPFRSPGTRYDYRTPFKAARAAAGVTEPPSRVPILGQRSLARAIP